MASSDISAMMKYRRILVVEDDFLIASQFARALTSFGVEIVGPVGSLGKAIELAETADFDCALVDINLRGLDAYPVADIILRRGSPMAFVSGYDRSHLPERYKNVPLIQKPVDPAEVARALSA
jgi:CheY-like chemotaxis protein